MTTKQSNGRIPLELQAVFLASNRGEEVHTPPPGNVAFRMFQSIFQRSSNKPQQIPAGTTTTKTTTTKTTTTKTTTTRGFFGLQMNRSRRSSAKEIIVDGKVKGQQGRSSTANAASFAERTCPVRDISFQTASPTRSRQTATTYNSRSVINSTPDDVSVTSSITFTVGREGKTKTKKTKKKTPQTYIDAMMKNRGYTKKRCYALECGYHNKTTRTQRLSYHAYIVDLVKDGKVDTLRKLFATGLSTNPANVHGEGLINLVCRLGNSDILKVMIDAGCDIQVSDDYGRTPLHDACCATQTSFDVVEQLLKIDPYLPFVMDVRGSLPLSYVQEEDYGKWINFLQSHEHEIWPFRVSKHRPIPPLSLQLPNTRPIPEPNVMLPSVFIEMLASGRMTPEEVTALHDFDESSDDSDDSYFDDDDDDDGDDDEEEGDDDENDKDEVAIEDFDPDNCSFGRMSAGGYTFDFSESNHESGADNLDQNEDIDDVDPLCIDNIDMVKSLSPNKSSRNKPTRLNNVSRTEFSKDISNHALIRKRDVIKSQLSPERSSEDKTASNDTQRTISETDVHTIELCHDATRKNDVDVVLSQSIDQLLLENKATPSSKIVVPSRTISAPVRVTTALMKQHIQSSQSHQPIIPSVNKDDGIVVYPTLTRTGFLPKIETNDHNNKCCDIRMNENTTTTKPQEIDWKPKTNNCDNLLLSNMVVVIPTVTKVDESSI